MEGGSSRSGVGSFECKPSIIDQHVDCPVLLLDLKASKQMRENPAVFKSGEK